MGGGLVINGGSLEDYLHIVRSGPAQYFHRRAVLKDAGRLVARFGRRALVSGGRRALQAVEADLFPSLREAGVEHSRNVFVGESSESNVARLLEVAEARRPDFLIGVGGGKALDTAKIAADHLRLPIVTIPTIAATCAASTPLAIFYSDDGVYQRDYYPVANPQMVLVDPDVLVKAPIEHLKSGILDSLAKWYKGGASFAGADDADLYDTVAIELAEHLNSRMMEKAGPAIRAAEQGRISDEFTDVVNMNIYLAGTIQAFGVKAVRNGIAHAVHNGLTVLKESHGLRHGIKVGYGIAVQLSILERRGERLPQLFGFYRDIGFVPAFRNLGLTFSGENVAAAARKTIADPLMKRKPFDVIRLEAVADAMDYLESRSKGTE